MKHIFTLRYIIISCACVRMFMRVCVHIRQKDTRIKAHKTAKKLWFLVICEGCKRYNQKNDLRFVSLL